MRKTCFRSRGQRGDTTIHGGMSYTGRVGGGSASKSSSDVGGSIIDAPPDGGGDEAGSWILLIWLLLALQPVA